MLVVIGVALASASGSGAEPSATRPNIVLILADDLGWKDVGYQGGAAFETPCIDRLAAEGMVFSAGYAAAANCAPSRACLLSGLFTPRHGLFAVGHTARGPLEAQRLEPVPSKVGLGGEHVTFAEALRDAGYATALVGKWHLDGPDGAAPEAQGFDVVRHAGHHWQGESAADPKGVFSLTQAACEFVTANRDRPFLLHLSHYAIHTPLQARSASRDQFAARPRAAVDPLYAACVHDLDAAVGILVEHLRAQGLDERTLVVFTSDNGATRESSQEPLRGNKGSYYEGGIRVPFVVRWPGVTRPGSTCGEPVTSIDLFPTFLEAAGAVVPDSAPLDGESLVRLFEDARPFGRRTIFWHFPGYLDGPVERGRPIDVRDGFRTRPVSVIHKGPWKLLLHHEEWQLDGGRAAAATSGAVELYDLDADIGERHDRAATNSAKRNELLDDLEAWLEATAAPVPTRPNPVFSGPQTGPGGSAGESP